MPGANTPNSPSRQPRISNARRIGKNALVGAFDLHLVSGFVFRGCMLLESHGVRWINFPGEQWTKPDGTKAWKKPFVEFETREARDRFQAQILPLAEAAFGLEASDVA